MRELQAKYAGWRARHVATMCVYTALSTAGAAVAARFSWPDNTVVGCLALGASVVLGVWFVFYWPDTYRPGRVEDPLMMVVAGFFAVWAVGLYHLAGWFPVAVTSTAGAANGVTSVFFIVRYRHHAPAIADA